MFVSKLASASHETGAAEKTTSLDHASLEKTGASTPQVQNELSGLTSALRSRPSLQTSATGRPVSEDSDDALDQPAKQMSPTGENPDSALTATSGNPTAEGSTKPEPSPVASESASSVEAAQSASPVEAAHKDDISPNRIQDAFESGGLLIRTVQDRNAVEEFKHTSVSIDQAKENRKNGVTRHDGLRKWSLAHADVKPNYYKMGSEEPFPRTLGVLAMPDKVGGHVVGVHAKDNFSGGITDSMKNLSPEDAKAQMGSVLNFMKEEQKQRPGKRLENSEIQTVGIPSDSVAGLMYRPTSGPASAEDWKTAKSKVESRLSGAGAEFHGRTLPVFTYAEDGSKTKLTHLGSVTIPVPKS